jgi:hypothetical protein
MTLWVGDVLKERLGVDDIVEVSEPVEVRLQEEVVESVDDCEELEDEVEVLVRENDWEISKVLEKVEDWLSEWE